VCYYSSIAVGFKIIETRFGVRFLQTESFKPVYSASAFTVPQMPVITDEDPEQVTLLQWGLIPSWVKDTEAALHIKQYGLNARCETIFEKPMFRHSILSKRCLAVVDGFFEWRHFNNKRYPYYIRLNDHQPFALASIWDRWHSHDNNEVISTFSIVTTSANPLMAQIHNTKQRMPVIFKREDDRRWLGSLLQIPEIDSLLKPYDPSEMEAYTVDKAIAKLGFNTTHQEILERKDYSELPSL